MTPTTKKAVGITFQASALLTVIALLLTTLWRAEKRAEGQEAAAYKQSSRDTEQDVKITRNVEDLQRQDVNHRADIKEIQADIKDEGRRAQSRHIEVLKTIQELRSGALP